MGDVILAPVDVSDVAEMVELHALAFKTDAFSNLMLMGRDSDAHQRLMTTAIQTWFDDPAAELAKAVDGSGKMVGWTCWITKAAEKPTRLSANAGKLSEESKQGRSEERKSENGADKPKEAKSPQQVLGGLKNQDLVQQEAKHMNGGEYLVLQGMATHPDHQRRGIGAKLARWGTDKADERGLRCWTHSSPVGKSTYVKAGFEQVGSVSYNLDEWVPVSHAGGDRLGTYTFYYMRRLG